VPNKPAKEDDTVRISGGKLLREKKKRDKEEEMKRNKAATAEKKAAATEKKAAAAVKKVALTLRNGTGRSPSMDKPVLLQDRLSRQEVVLLWWILKLLHHQHQLLIQCGSAHSALNVMRPRTTKTG